MGTIRIPFTIVVKPGPPPIDDPSVREHNSLDFDLQDAKISLSSIQEFDRILNEKTDHKVGSALNIKTPIKGEIGDFGDRKSYQFHITNTKVIKTWIRVFCSSVILNIVKTLEENKDGYTIYSLINKAEHLPRKDKTKLIEKCKSLTESKLYEQLEKYRDKLIAHRDKIIPLEADTRTYEDIQLAYEKCTKFLMANMEEIDELIDKMVDIFWDIRKSQTEFLKIVYKPMKSY